MNREAVEINQVIEQKILAVAQDGEKRFSQGKSHRFIKLSAPIIARGLLSHFFIKGLTVGQITKRVRKIVETLKSNGVIDCGPGKRTIRFSRSGAISSNGNGRKIILRKSN